MGSKAKTERRERRALDRMIEAGNGRNALVAAMRIGQRRIAEADRAKLDAPLALTPPAEEEGDTPCDD